MKGREWVNTCQKLVAVEAPNEKLAKGGAAPLDLSSPEGKGPDPERERGAGREGGSGVLDRGERADSFH